ncbi:hypothetical protein [uncultured Thiodictyon sp.]|uniref:hypothetical protein n=1 Tax=uncultured Thiodictyon sp. TaxID=1846217 RepID=UPI0025FFF67D|nr:hypothetical protein [uncultured Thiodictyon sp.]
MDALDKHLPGQAVEDLVESKPNDAQAASAALGGRWVQCSLSDRSTRCAEGLSHAQA